MRVDVESIDLCWRQISLLRFCHILLEVFEHRLRDGLHIGRLQALDKVLQADLEAFGQKLFVSLNQALLAWPDVVSARG